MCTFCQSYACFIHLDIGSFAQTRPRSNYTVDTHVDTWISINNINQDLSIWSFLMLVNLVLVFAKIELLKQ